MNKIVFINEFTNFTKQTITGIYMYLYRNQIEINDENTRLILLIEYMNMCYKNLILQDDIYIKNTFDKMQLYSGYSPLCLLHNVMAISKVVVKSLDNIKSFLPCPIDELREKLSTIIWLIITPMINEVFKDQHKCDGPKTLTDCDSEVPLFFVSAEPIIN